MSLMRIRIVKPLSPGSLWGLFWVSVLAWGSTSCGYTLQNSHSDLLDKEGIRTVYVKPLINNTFEPGIENVVYNALIRTMLAHRRVKLVQNEADADAVLQGSVNTAQFAIAGATAASSLYPVAQPNGPPNSNFKYGSGLDLGNTSVASVYNASLGCAFVLNRTGILRPGKSKQLWTSAFIKSKFFSAANQLDVPGATSALINESEFERALSEMSTDMMDDVHEFMLAMF